MKAYPAYKESGSEWIGKIPGQWESIRFKYLFEEIYRYPTYYGITYQNQGVLEIRGMMLRSGGIIDTTSDPRYISLETSSNFPRTKLQSGDLVMSVRGTLGKIGLVTKEIEGSNITANLIRLSPKRTRMFPKFLVYLMESNYFANILNFVSDQTTIKTITVPSLVASVLPVPSLPEQEIITNFLDRKTAQIDTLIEKKQRQIDLLHEQRTALINHAVTKGLNPNVSMKDSGVEWYGEIPHHWDMKRLGRITSVIMDIDHKMPLAVEDGIPFLSAKDLLNDGTLNFENDVKKISEEDFLKLSRKIQPKRNDIIYSRIGARLGKARLVETDQKFLVSYSCCVVRVIEEMALPEYIRFIMDSEILLTEAKARTVGIGVPDLGLGEIAKFPIPLPPKTEQEAILEFLKKNDSKIKSGIKDISNQIDLLNEYRTALISEAVTGKIDVRTVHE